MPKRRPNGEGSFYYRKRDKRWVATFNGQTQTDRIKEQALAKFHQMKKAALAGYDHQRAKSQLATVESLCERLFHSSMSPSTVTQYRSGRPPGRTQIPGPPRAEQFPTWERFALAHFLKGYPVPCPLIP